MKGLAGLERASDAEGIRRCVPFFREALCSYADKEEGFLSVCTEIAVWYDGNTRKLVDEHSVKNDSNCIKRGILFRDLERELIGLIAAGLVTENAETSYVKKRKADMVAASDAYFAEGMESLAKAEIVQQRVSGPCTMLIVLALRNADGRENYLSRFADAAPGIFAVHFTRACDPASGKGWMGYRDVWNAYVGLLKEMASAIPERNQLSGALKDGSEVALKGAFDELRSARPPWADFKEVMLHSAGRASAACAPFPEILRRSGGKTRICFQAPGVLAVQEANQSGREGNRGVQIPYRLPAGTPLKGCSPNLIYLI